MGGRAGGHGRHRKRVAVAGGGAGRGRGRGEGPVARRAVDHRVGGSRGPMEGRQLRGEVEGRGRGIAPARPHRHLLSGLEDAVAVRRRTGDRIDDQRLGRKGARFADARRVATVSDGDVAVVALLERLHDAVAAGGRRNGARHAGVVARGRSRGDEIVCAVVGVVAEVEDRGQAADVEPACDRAAAHQADGCVLRSAYAGRAAGITAPRGTVDVSESGGIEEAHLAAQRRQGGGHREVRDQWPAGGEERLCLGGGEKDRGLVGAVRHVGREGEGRDEVPRVAEDADLLSGDEIFSRRRKLQHDVLGVGRRMRPRVDLLDLDQVERCERHVGAHERGDEHGGERRERGHHDLQDPGGRSWRKMIRRSRLRRW